MEFPQLINLNQKNLRACIGCAYINTSEFFSNNGCPNCPFFHTKKKNSSVYKDYTSGRYNGIVLILDKNSWVKNWQKLPPNAINGYYAITIARQLSIDKVELLESYGRVYIDRTKPFIVN